MKFKEWLSLDEAAPKDAAFSSINVPYDVRQRYGPTGRYGTPAPELSRAFHMLPAGVGSGFDDAMYGHGSTARPGTALGGEFPDQVDMPDDDTVSVLMPLMPENWWNRPDAIYDVKLHHSDNRNDDNKLNTVPFVKVVDKESAQKAARYAAIDLCWSIMRGKLTEAGMSEDEIEATYNTHPEILEDRPMALQSPQESKGVKYEAGSPGWKVVCRYNKHPVYDPRDEVGHRSSDVIKNSYGFQGHAGHQSTPFNRHRKGQWADQHQTTQNRQYRRPGS